MACDESFALVQITRLRNHPEFHFRTGEDLNAMASDLATASRSDDHCRRIVDFFLRNNGSEDPLPMLADWLAAAAEVPIEEAVRSTGAASCPACHGRGYVVVCCRMTAMPAGRGYQLAAEEIGEESYRDLLSQHYPTSVANMGADRRFVAQAARSCRECAVQARKTA